MIRKCCFSILVISLVTLGQAGNLGAVKFRCQQISEPGPNFSPIRVNDKGQILGSIGAEPFIHAAIWAPGSGTPQDLGTLGGTYSIPHDFNEAGEVVGKSLTSSGTTHAFIWDQTQGIRDLGLLGGEGGNEAIAYGINNHGSVVGYSDTPPDPPENYRGIRSVVWSGDNIVDLGPVSSIPHNCINDYYFITGTEQTVGGFEPRLLLPLMGYPVSLGLLPGDGDCRIVKINNKGHVVGYSHPLVNIIPTHGCLWSYGNPPQDLCSLGGTFTKPYDINDSDWIVGESRHSGAAVTDAFLHIPQDGMQDLNNLLVNPLQYPEHLIMANCINNRGQIVSVSNYQIIYLLTPIKGTVPYLLLLSD
jgi:probable HAF family extracellular repeat protein